MAKSRTSFIAGRSGNPGGRPKAALSVQELARAHTEDAIRALVAALQSPRERVPAAVAILDRGWGKPAQTIQAADDATSFTFQHLIAAREVLVQINQERTIAGSVVAPETTNGGPTSPSNRTNTPRNLWEPADE